MDAKEHHSVKRETKKTRNAAAKARRGAQPGKAGGVTILRASDDAGGEYVLALGEKEPTRAYVLRRTDTGWACDCFTNKWQHRCAHVEAVTRELAS